MALRLEMATQTTPESWLRKQLAYELITSAKIDGCFLRVMRTKKLANLLVTIL